MLIDFSSPCFSSTIFCCREYWIKIHHCRDHIHLSPLETESAERENESENEKNSIKAIANFIHWVQFVCIIFCKMPWAKHTFSITIISWHAHNESCTCIAYTLFIRVCAHCRRVERGTTNNRQFSTALTFIKCHKFSWNYTTAKKKTVIIIFCIVYVRSVNDFRYILLLQNVYSSSCARCSLTMLQCYSARHDDNNNK